MPMLGEKGVQLGWNKLVVPMRSSACEESTLFSCVVDVNVCVPDLVLFCRRVLANTRA